MDKITHKMGVGIIVRDNMSKVLAMLSASKVFIISPDIAKAMAALKAITSCRDFGFLKVVPKGDALLIVQALKNSSSN